MRWEGGKIGTKVVGTGTKLMRHTVEAWDSHASSTSHLHERARVHSGTSLRQPRTYYSIPHSRHQGGRVGGCERRGHDPMPAPPLVNVADDDGVLILVGSGPLDGGSQGSGWKVERQVRWKAVGGIGGQWQGAKAGELLWVRGEGGGGGSWEVLYRGEGGEEGGRED